MILRPPNDIANYLDVNSTSLTLGTNLFIGPIRAHSAVIPAECAFVYASGAGPPDRLFNQEPEIRHLTVTVQVRSTAYDSGNTLARNVYQTLQSAGPTGYLDVVCQQSGPVMDGYDKNGFYVFRLDWNLMYNAASAEFLLPWQLV